MAQFNDDALWSAVKRRNIQDILAYVFTECGYEEAAKVAKDTARITNAAVLRIREALDTPVEVEETEVEDVVEDVVETDTEEIAEEMVAETEENEVTAIINKGKKLIAKGKAKKAKKLFKEHGLKGSEIKKLFVEGK